MMNEEKTKVKCARVFKQLTDEEKKKFKALGCKVVRNGSNQIFRYRIEFPKGWYAEYTDTFEEEIYMINDSSGNPIACIHLYDDFALEQIIAFNNEN